MKGHPSTICAVDVALYVPNCFADVAKYFANREMPRDQIESHVKSVLERAIQERGTDDQRKLQGLNRAVQQLADKYDEIDKGVVSVHTLDLKMNVLSKTEPDSLKITIFLCVNVMNDLLDKAFFTPPPAGSTSWVRHVEPLSKT